MEGEKGKYERFIPEANIMPRKNEDGTYTLIVSGMELSEIMKGLEYMERQREASRRYKERTNPRKMECTNKRILSLNILSAH